MCCACKLGCHSAAMVLEVWRGEARLQSKCQAVLLGEPIIVHSPMLRAVTIMPFGQILSVQSHCFTTQGYQFHPDHEKIWQLRITPFCNQIYPEVEPLIKDTMQKPLYNDTVLNLQNLSIISKISGPQRALFPPRGSTDNSNCKN